MISVSLDVSAVPAEPVGAGRYTIELVRALSVRDDVDLALWSRRSDGDRWRALHDGGKRAFVDGPVVGGAVGAVEDRAPDHRLTRMAWEQLRLPRLLAGSEAQVHHAPHYTMPGRTRLPVVVTIHDMTFFDHPQWHERVKVPVFRAAIRRAARRADALVCVSHHTASRLTALLAVRGRVFVVPHGVDHHRFRPVSPDPDTDAELLAVMGVQRPYVLFVGTLEPRKAVPDLVAAFATVASRQPRLQLVLAGRPGWGADEVARAIDESGVASRIRRTGYVPDPAVPALLRSASVVAYPARDEGFGLPALEALACGAPLVTTAGTAMAEMAGDGALLFPPGRVDLLAEALGTALHEGPDGQERRRRGLLTAAEHTWERSAAGHLAAYRWAADRADHGPDRTGEAHREAR